MKETVVLFGETESLAGVLTEPEPADYSTGPPAVVMLNAGLVHRIGPHRVHVTLARRLARSGVACLRFDLSGIGDSPPRRDTLPAREGALREISDAMDLLTQRCGAREFILFGICSGADYAFRVGRTSPEVVGLVLVDGYTYRTVGHYFWHYARRIFRRQSWLNVLQRKHPIWNLLTGPGTSNTNASAAPALGFYRKPARKDAEADLHAMVRRGLNLCVVHTSLRYNYHSQFKHTFPSVKVGPQVHVEFLEFSDHTFTLLASQNALAECVEHWIASAEWTSTLERGR